MATEDTQAQDALATTNADANTADKQTEPEKEAGTATGDTAQADEPSETEPDGDQADDVEAERPRRQPGSQRLKGRVAQLEAKLAEYETAKVGGDEIDRLVKQRLGDPPKETDFNGDYIAYERQLTAYESARYVVKGDVQRELNVRQQSAESARQEAMEDHVGRMKEAEKRIPDFKEVAAKASQLYVGDNVRDLILESEKSADLFYHFAKNPAVLSELNDLSPIKAAHRMGQIEARLNVPQPRKATGAPAPNSAVRGGASPAQTPEAALDAWLHKTYKR